MQVGVRYTGGPKEKVRGGKVKSKEEETRRAKGSKETDEKSEMERKQKTERGGAGKERKERTGGRNKRKPKGRNTEEKDQEEVENRTEESAQALATKAKSRKRCNVSVNRKQQNKCYRLRSCYFTSSFATLILKKTISSNVTSAKEHSPSSTGKCPAEVMFGRSVHTRLPQHKRKAEKYADDDVMRACDESAKEKMKQNANTRKKAKETLERSPSRKSKTST
ncbi:uncharacterized protein [Ambystoma mexicanum]|uniref:uncharacterized protein n=1 Tax=Ambystoma mexicanum TaxID=8296 RepID=UPI0037E81C4B